MGNKLMRFWQLESKDKRLLVEAIGRLAVARIMLALHSFEKLSARLAAGDDSASVEPNPEDLQRISYVISAAANNVPWRSDCFPQSIAARMMLRRRGIASTIHLGVERIGESDLAGHAWLTCGDTVVTGDVDLDRYTELHRYPQ